MINGLKKMFYASFKLDSSTFQDNFSSKVKIVFDVIDECNILSKYKNQLQDVIDLLRCDESSTDKTIQNSRIDTAYQALKSLAS